jgi:hypothetical protein
MKKLLSVAFVFAFLGAAARAQAQFIGGLDGVSNSSTFENGVIVPLPVDGWTNVSGTAQVFDIAAGNGSVIGTTNFNNYEVQYLTGVPIAPNAQYTLHFDMGFVAGIVGGSASYSFQLGTVDAGLVFTPLGPPATGTIARTGNMFSGVISGSANLVFATGTTVSGNNLAVRWAQTSNPGPSDFFGFDNVTLAVGPAPVPVPALGPIATALLGFVLLLAGFTVLRRRA